MKAIGPSIVSAKYRIQVVMIPFISIVIGLNVQIVKYGNTYDAFIQNTLKLKYVLYSIVMFEFEF